ncbi:hypothetical protein [Methylobacterium mesophilicum]|uniref:hypothetical protein n=1 Tax=Methylobacterium mesophilicum TaxID=39956 RepID=UPI001EE3360A|nr:hypothetical protein [Methylobacterium mesophilicum]
MKPTISSLVSIHSWHSFQVPILSLAFMFSAPAQAQIGRIAGGWVNESGYQVKIVPNSLGGYDLYSGNVNGEGAIENDGSFGGNAKVEFRNAVCYYRISIISGETRMIWQLLDGNASCLHGYFDKMDSDASTKISDNSIERRKIKHDFVQSDSSYGYEVFVFERPIYSFVDKSSERIPIYYAACTVNNCNPETYQRAFCKLMGLKPASLLDGAVLPIGNLDFSHAWVWDLLQGRSIRSASDARGGSYFNTITCRK